MREPRNPFRMRLSEHIESDSAFLRLFGPGVFDLLPKDGLWDRVQIFRSAPGGGKTSLFRTFTSSSLVTLYESRAVDDYKELYQRMADLGAIAETGPQLLGVILSCARNYAHLGDLVLDESRKERLLFALINARMVLAVLRGALALKKLDFPAGLSELSITLPVLGEVSVQLPIPGSGRDLYDWASLLERQVCEAIDSFDPALEDKLEGHDTLYSLLMLRPDSILHNGTPVAGRVLIMLDDVHKLTNAQRQTLLGTLLDIRPLVSVWLAERLEALSPSEILGVGATTGREYGKPILLEEYWRPSSKRFEGVTTNIADRRVKFTRDVQVGSFAACLLDSVDGSGLQQRFVDALQIISTRVLEKASGSKRYSEWLKTVQEQSGTVREQALAWRTVEIIIERDVRKPQLAFDFALPPEELEKREESATKGAAELALAREFDIPYYYGFSRLAVLSSSNIEQFLAFSGELFEEIISSALLRRQSVLTPERQELILKRIAQQRWDEIPRRIPNGRDVQKFLDAIQQCARWENDKPNVPYAPGVSGIAISMEDRARLLEPNAWKERPDYRRLVDVISTSLVYNLLEVSLDRSQGKPGNTWMLLYLNRWLCLHFRLPLHYGGWRPKKLTELSNWMDHGFRPTKEII